MRRPGRSRSPFQTEKLPLASEARIGVPEVLILCIILFPFGKNKYSINTSGGAGLSWIHGNAQLTVSLGCTFICGYLKALPTSVLV